MADAIRFRRLGTMLDCSRNAVMTVESVRRWIDVTAELGYNCLLLYIEDTYEIKGQPYFGHLRGRYSQQELKEIDDYAAAKGMEVIPCIQTLAHVNALFQWDEYNKIRDVDDILLAGDDRVYELIDQMFAAMKGSLRTNIINIGMDEAHLLGRGAYMDQNGVHDRFDILMTHLNRVSKLAEKYGFELLMWGDMFFRLANGSSYYADHVEISDQVKAMVPKNVKLVYWDYYSTDEQHYDRQIALHKSIKEDIWFAGGLWTWSGIAPHNSFSIDAMGPAMNSCLAHGVQDVMMTMWGDNGGECSKFAMLPSLYFVSEYAKGHTDPAAIKAGFEAKFGIPFDDFLNLDLLGTPNEKKKEIVNPDKYMLYNDCFMGMMDCLAEEGAGASYGACGERLAKWKDHPEYGYLFRTEEALCRVLEIKYELGLRTRKAYTAGDHKACKALLSDYDELLRRIDALYQAYAQQWNRDNKFFGFDVQDIRFGGLMQRVKHCRARLEAYAGGMLEEIEELEAPALDFLCRENGEGAGKPIQFNSWQRTVSPGVI